MKEGIIKKEVVGWCQSAYSTHSDTIVALKICEDFLFVVLWEGQKSPTNTASGHVIPYAAPSQPSIPR